MLTLHQKIGAGLELKGLCEKHALVRRYVSLVLRLAPGKYKRLLKLGNTAGALLALLAVCVIVGRA